MSKRTNKRKKEKKKPRQKHPELGRIALAKRPSSRSRTFGKKEDNKKKYMCSVCNKRRVTHVIIGAGNVRNICDCNIHLVDEALEKLRKRKQEKIDNRPLKVGQVKTISFTPEKEK